MEEIHGWWEIPAVTHFCYVFRAAFNLIYFDVTELEAAILNLQDPEMSISFEQLVTRIVQGCFKEGEVTSVNLDEKLNELFEEYSDDDENSLNGVTLYKLTPRAKVELLLKLCQIRLDIAVSMDAIKDMPGEVMQAKCIGQDSQKYSYWYFSDERLYKENLSKTAVEVGKQNIPEKGKKSGNQHIKNNRQSARDKKDKSSMGRNKLWSIVCHNLNDWEKLVRKFSRSKESSEKELGKEIKNTYIPLVQEAIAERERFLRKRYIELAPKRTSSRISKVQAQKRLEEQRAAEAEEQRRREYEMELAKKEEEKKKQEIEDRRKRVEERRKIVEDRARRAQQRGMLRNFIGDYDDSNSSDHFKRTLRTNSSSRTGNSANDSDDSDSESQDVDVDSDKSEQSSEEEDSNKEESSCDEESANEAESSNDSENMDSSSTSNRGKRKYEQDVVHTYDLTQWRSTISSNGQGLHLLRNSTSDITERKHFKLNEATNYKVPSVNGCNSSPRKEVHNYQTPFQMRNCNTYSAAARQAIVRIDFIKPPNKQISS